MLIKNNQPFRQINFGFHKLLLLIFISTAEVWAQVRSITPAAPPAAAGEDFTRWYVMLFVLVVGLAGAIYWQFSSKKAQDNPNPKPSANSGGDTQAKAVDAGKELEWLRQNQKLVGKKITQTDSTQRRSKNMPKVAAVSQQREVKQADSPSKKKEESSALLPIFSVHRLELARPFDALPISDDEDLLSAIEQSYDEFEEDEEVRDLALRIMAAFKKRNSVEALAQTALYDLSSNLRSKAITVLSEFDHESVFETILLANADPTREVRAAAARALTKLTFDRADAWTRIAETGEEGRIAQSAGAAMESGFVDMSFDRLVSKDHKQAYEAFTLMALLINAGETAKIFNALETSRDMNIRRAILHIIKVTKDEKTLDELYLLLEKNSLPPEIQEEVNRIIEEIGCVTV